MDANEFNRLVITFLANESCLYDMDSPFYNNINERHQAYIRIGQQLRECGVSDDQGVLLFSLPIFYCIDLVNRVNDRFQALKRRFLSEHRRVRNGALSSWPHYYALEKLLGKFADRSIQLVFIPILISVY